MRTFFSTDSLRLTDDHLDVQDLSFATTQQKLESTLQSTSANGEFTWIRSNEDQPEVPMFTSINEFNPTPNKPFVLGLPTGSSPIPTYRALIRMVKEGKLSYVCLVQIS